MENLRHFNSKTAGGFRAVWWKPGVCVEDGRITAVRFRGDFLARRDVGQIEEALRGCRYRREDLEAVLERCPVGECFGAISGEEIAQCLLEAQP